MLVTLQQKANRPLALNVTKTPGIESSSSSDDDDQDIDFVNRMNQ